MNSIQTARKSPDRRTVPQKILHLIVDYRYLHLMVLPGLIFFLIFKYIPMYGIVIGFKYYKGASGGLATILSAPWVGLQNFEIFFNSIYCARVFKNTIEGLLQKTKICNSPIFICKTGFSAPKSVY